METKQDIAEIGQDVGLAVDGDERGEEEEPPNLKDQLEHFREQWRQELYLRNKADSTESDRASLEEQVFESIKPFRNKPWFLHVCHKVI